MKMNKLKVIGSQVLSAELVFGLLLSVAYRTCSSLAFSSEVGFVCEVMQLCNRLYLLVNVKLLFLCGKCLPKMLQFLSEITEE